MFNVYVPDFIYERLPKIYLLLALALAVAPLWPVKWVAIAALLAVTMITHSRRQKYREQQRNREMAAIMEKYRR